MRTLHNCKAGLHTHQTRFLNIEWLFATVGAALCVRMLAGPLAIGISFVAAGLAAANLLLDMDWIEKASYQGLPKWMEWYGAQSLMLTLVSHPARGCGRQHRTQQRKKGGACRAQRATSSEDRSRHLYMTVCISRVVTSGTDQLWLRRNT